jgi:hypothetical protein
VADNVAAEHENEEFLMQLALSDTSDPNVRLRMLAYRVSVLTKEKEAIEKRLAKMERVYNMGAGVLWAIPFLAGVVGFITAWLKGIVSMSLTK